MVSVPRLHLLTHPDQNMVWYRRLLESVAHKDLSTVAIHLRDKSSSSKELLEKAAVLGRNGTNAKLFINGRTDVAMMSAAFGVQLGEKALSPNDAASLAPSLCIGASRHSQEGMLRAVENGAHFVTVSPIFGVPNKNPPLGLQGLAAMTHKDFKTIALGGIREENATGVMRAGAYGLMVQRCIAHAQAPRETLLNLIDLVAS